MNEDELNKIKRDWKDHPAPSAKIVLRMVNHLEVAEAELFRMRRRSEEYYARAMQAEDALAEVSRFMDSELKGSPLDWIRLAQKHEKTLAAIEAILNDPPVPSRMLIPVIRNVIHPEEHP